jgi:hypothetical protein
MSDLAYQRFTASYMLTNEEQLPENRQEIIDTSLGIKFGNDANFLIASLSLGSNTSCPFLLVYLIRLA